MTVDDIKPSIADPNAPVWEQLPDWEQHYGLFQMQFSEFLRQEPAIAGRVLDIGCGGRLHPTLAHVRARCHQMDGVDPGPEVMENPNLTLRWQSPFETADIPADTYDAAISYYVVEHIKDPSGFLRAVHRVLKPGGIFWAMTPHRNHPFCQLVLLAQWLGLKKEMAQRNSGINDYPAYYRLNRSSSVMKRARESGFDDVHFHYLLSPNWYKGYAPRALWWMLWTYDAMFSSRFEKLRQILAFRLKKDNSME